MSSLEEETVSTVLSLLQLSPAHGRRGGFRNQSEHARQTRTSLASAIMSEIISSSLENAPVFNTREVVKVYDVGEV